VLSQQKTDHKRGVAKDKESTNDGQTGSFHAVSSNHVHMHYMAQKFAKQSGVGSHVRHADID